MGLSACGAAARRTGGHHLREPTVSGFIGLGMRFLKDEGGATAIEYAIIAGLLSIVIVVSVNAVGTSLNTTFTSVSTALK